ncbi:PREDICTED: putative pectinesterase 11 [Theobroma cacao]|uniref:pectinesterase n=1 Tax=Theobroma cacao TaxID=3641 RepID=A0AB32WUQ9_THECC|nr:PREDICTED: putative pectinesterase 11 [Theobroma cacao]
MASPQSIYAAENPAAILIRVDPSGKGDYRKIQDAIDAVPSNNKEVVFILVKPGIYKEKIVVPADRPFITISGSKANGTIITWDDSGNIFESPTFSVLASDFVARYLTIQNTHGAGAKAVALRVSRDRVAFFGCRILSYQDTLLDDTGRHYYSGCYIEGAVDFICGNAASLFERCHLHSLSEGDAAITAQRRESPSEDTGFTFLGCKVTGVKTALLGRAWGPYSRVVFALTYMSNVILPQGWDYWGDSSKQSSVFYREYKCYGPGANTKKRVEWSQELTGIEAQPFLTKNMIGGKSWIRSTPTRFKKASTAISNNSTRHA